MLARLIQEVGAGVEERAPDDRHGPAVALPLRLAGSAGALSFITTTVFGTPLDVMLSEIVLETFLPADEATAAALRAR